MGISGYCKRSIWEWLYGIRPVSIVNRSMPRLQMSMEGLWGTRWQHSGARKPAVPMAPLTGCDGLCFVAMPMSMSFNVSSSLGLSVGLCTNRTFSGLRSRCRYPLQSGGRHQHGEGGGGGGVRGAKTRSTELVSLSLFYKGKERKGKERKGKEKKGKERKGKERRGEERRGEERRGEERRGEERRGEEWKGKERKFLTSGVTYLMGFIQQHGKQTIHAPYEGTTLSYKACVDQPGKAA